MNHKTSSNSGLSIVATVMIMMILALFAAVAVSLVTTGTGVGIQEERSMEAFYIAEGGLEYILANRSVPNYSTQGATTALGSGNFVVSTPTYVKTSAVAIGNTTINVDSTTGFPTPAGKIVIDSEIMPYTATTSNTFTIPAPGAKEAHAIGNAVYPATSVSVDPGAGGTTITVASTTGFVMPGVIKIDNEYIYCASTNAPLTTQFTNCTRSYKRTTAAAHAAGSNVFQYIVRSAGTTALNLLSSPMKRVVEKTAAGISVKQGTLIKTTAGAPVSQSVTGIGFKPNAVIFFWTRQVAEGFSNGDNPNANDNFGVGFATGPANERAVSVTALDASGSSADGRRRSDNKMIIFLTGGGSPALAAEAELTSLDADGFTINWTTNNARAYIIHYIALGGDISNAFAGTFNLTNGAGNDSVNTLAFQPDFVMFLWSFTEAVNTDTADAEVGIGFAQSPTARGAMVYAAEDGRGTNNSKRWQQRTDSVILILNPAANPPNQDAIADFVSMDANGFTVSKSTLPAANVPIFYLALKGGSHKVSSFNQPAATGNQTQTGVGFRPQELILLSKNLVTSPNIQGGVGPEVSGAISLGAAQAPTARGSAWVQDRNVDSSDANMYTATTDALTLASGPATVRAQANLVSFDDNGFTLAWTVNEGTAREILYWAIGPNPKASNILWREVFQ
jgi:hypothetical protein